MSGRNNSLLASSTSGLKPWRARHGSNLNCDNRSEIELAMKYFSRCGLRTFDVVLRRFHDYVGAGTRSTLIARQNRLARDRLAFAFAKSFNRITHDTEFLAVAGKKQQE